MQEKYFNVTVKPTIAASKQTAAFGTNDVLFDWHAFDIPSGAARLISITTVIRGTDAAKQSTDRDLTLLFAKSIDGVAPTSVGTVNATAGGIGFELNIIGKARVENTTGEYTAAILDRFSVASSGYGAAANQHSFGVLTGEPNTGANVGYDTIYVAGFTSGSLDFSTTVLARGGEAAGVTVVETDKGSDDDPDADKIFVPGDVLHSATDDVLGTVASISAFGSSKQDINFTAATTDIIADNEEIYNIHPVHFIFSFEK